ncbi:unnamed protein product [Arabidopsis halleri]
MENSSFESLPQALQDDILSRLPLKSLVKLKCILVSKKWASIIRGEEFKALYLSRSMTKPRVMLMVERWTSRPHEPAMSWFRSVYEEQRRTPVPDAYEEVLFHSVYQEKKPSLSSGQQQLRIPFEKVGSDISQPIRGLICLHLDGKVAICNPGTKKYHILPEIPAHFTNTKCFFGYDEDTNVFKVLCIKTRYLQSTIPFSEYHVLTVEFGAEPSYWRPIICKPDCSILTEGLFKGGFLYYGAESSSGKNLVVRFNVTSEEFTIWEFPDDDFSFPTWKFVIYKGNIALVDDFAFFPGAEIDQDGTFAFPILVLDEISVKFKREIIKIRGWEQKVEKDEVFYFKGTIGTGELVFAQGSGRGGLVIGPSFSILYYDTEDFLSRSKIEAVSGIQILAAQTFLDHVDSTWLI